MPHQLTAVGYRGEPMLDHASTEAGRPTAVPFQVHLDVFEGPFDLLLGLLAKHQLDVTEVALSRVTDEFIAHLRAHGW